MTNIQLNRCNTCRCPSVVTGNPVVSLESFHSIFCGVRRIAGSYDQLFRWDTLEDIPLI